MFQKCLISLNWKASMRFLANEVRVIARVLRHPHSPWPARLIAAGATAYVLSPVQLIPTFIPIVGQLDDLFVICTAIRWIRRITPAAVFAECTGAGCRPPVQEPLGGQYTTI
jgi:uncharacterized membrane protein YkvA (DUF1232 family)